MINGWNARSLAVMSGRQIKDEARKPSFDLVSALRVRRLRWLGHVLRMDDRRLVKHLKMWSGKNRASCESTPPKEESKLKASLETIWLGMETDNSNLGVNFRILASVGPLRVRDLK